MSQPASILDMSQLEMMTGGDAPLAAEALGIFRNQAELWGRMLDPHGPAQQWADAAHTIKGAARAMGLEPLAETCGRAETAGRDPGVSAAGAAVAVNEVRDRLAEALEVVAEAEHQLMLHGSFRALQSRSSR